MLLNDHFFFLFLSYLRLLFSTLSHVITLKLLISDFSFYFSVIRIDGQKCFLVWSLKPPPLI